MQSCGSISLGSIRRKSTEIQSRATIPCPNSHEERQKANEWLLFHFGFPFRLEGGFCQVPLDCKFDQLHHSVDIQLAHEIRAVRVYGLGTKVQQFGNVLLAFQ